MIPRRERFVLGPRAWRRVLGPQAWRRILAGAAVLAVVVTAALVAIAPRSDAEARAVLDRAIAQMDDLRTVHFEIRGTVRADSPFPEAQPAGGTLNQNVHVWGDIVFPDQMHLSANIGPRDEGPRELLVIGERAWAQVGGGWRPIMARGVSTDPRFVLDLLKGPGVVRFVGYGVNEARLTYHLRIELDGKALEDRQQRQGMVLAAQMSGRGHLDVYIGVLDGRIYRQEVEIVEHSGEELAEGSALYRVRTSYGVDYRDFDAPVVIRPPPDRD